MSEYEANKATIEKADNAFTNYVNSTDKTVEAIKDMKQGLQNAKSKMEESSAENQAAEISQQAVLSVSDALKLIDEENEARAAYRKQASEYMSTTVAAFSKTISSGAQVLGTRMDEMFGLAGDADNSKLSGKQRIGLGALMTLGVGATVALLPGGSLRDTATDALGGYMNLNDNNEIDPDVDAKQIEGHEDDGAFLADTAEKAAGGPDAYDKGAVGAETSEKHEIKEDGSYRPPSSDDALDIPDTELDRIATLGNTIRENVKESIQGALGVKNIMSKGDGEPSLAGSIASFAGAALGIPGAEKGAPSKALSALNAYRGKLEEKQQEREDQEQGRDAGHGGYGD